MTSHVRVMSAILAAVLLSAIAEADSVAELTPEREAAALTFARRHHAELVELLASLKPMDSARYASAIAELFQTSERLAKLKTRMPERYRIDLQVWKIDSRVRLLAARCANAMGDEIRHEIRSLLMQRNELRAAQLEADQERMAARIQKLQQTIDHLRSENSQLADRELNRLLGTVRSRSEARKSTSGTTQK